MNRTTGLVLLVIALAAVIILASCTGKQPTTVTKEPSAVKQQNISDTPAAPGERIQWAEDLDTALMQAREQNKKVLIDFYTDWCGYCKKLEAETFPDPGVAALLNEHVIAVKINAEKKTEIAGKYAVRGYPTIVVTDAEGKEADRITGFLPPTEFRQRIAEILGV